LFEPEPAPTPEPEPEPEPETEPAQMPEPVAIAPSKAKASEATVTKPAPEENIAPPENAHKKAPQIALGKRQLSRLHLGWSALAASVLFVMTLVILFRVPVVKALPGMASLYEKVGYPVNIRGLEFASLSHQWMNKDGRSQLVVRGEIINITDDAVPVPEIIFTMLDKSNLEFFQWTERSGSKKLSPRARTRFRAQIPAPVERVRQLKIRFAKR